MLTKIYADSPDYRLLTELVDEQEDVADITDDATLVGGQVLDVTTDTFPVAVEIDTDQVTVLIEDGATGVTARGVGRSSEVDRHLIRAVSLLSCPTLAFAVELLLVDLLETSGDSELP